jgi:hypothetical protein
MFMQPREPYLVNISQLVFFDQLNEQPEREGIRAMHKQLTNQKVHTLHVIGLVVVASEGPKNLPKPLVPLLAYFEILVFRECPS